jgi:hypothetical protein
MNAPPTKESGIKQPLVVPAPICGVVVRSSWHLPVACAFEPGHEGNHSWASIPQFAPTRELAERGASLVEAYRKTRKRSG